MWLMLVCGVLWMMVLKFLVLIVWLWWCSMRGMCCLLFVVFLVLRLLLVGCGLMIFMLGGSVGLSLIELVVMLLVEFED